MAEIELVQERLISGTGVLKVPPSKKVIRYRRVLIDIVREVAEPHRSNKYSPSRSRYCTLTCLRDGSVIDEYPIDYQHRCIDFVPDISGQVLIAVKCAYKGILQTFVNLGLALNLVPISVDNKIAGYQSLNLLWDELQVVCEGDTAVQLRLYEMEYDDDCMSADEDKPAPPAPPLPPVPPGTPIGSISPPYPGDTVTDPSPLDEYEDPPVDPVGDNCKIYAVTFDYVNTRGELFTNKSGFVYGEYSLPITWRATSSNTYEFLMMCRGGDPSKESLIQYPCGDYKSYRFTSTAVEGIPNRVLNVTIVPSP